MLSETQKTLAIAVAVLAAGISIPIIVVFLLVGIWWWLALVIGLVAAIVLVIQRWKAALPYVVKKLGAVQTDHARLPQASNLVEGLLLRAGLETPDFFVIEDPALNIAPVVGSEKTALVFTSGLLDSLSRIQLEGVVAVALARIKSGDAEAATLGAALYGLPLLGSPLASVVEPLAGWSLSRLLDADRDLDGDIAGMMLTRYPPGLSSAFGEIDGKTTTPVRANAGSNHIWVMSDSETKSLVPHSPLDWRIEVLTEL